MDLILRLVTMRIASEATYEYLGQECFEGPNCFEFVAEAVLDLCPCDTPISYDDPGLVALNYG